MGKPNSINTDLSNPSVSAAVTREMQNAYLKGPKDGLPGKTWQAIIISEPTKILWDETVPLNSTVGAGIAFTGESLEVVAFNVRTIPWQAKQVETHQTDTPRHPDVGKTTPIDLDPEQVDKHLLIPWWPGVVDADPGLMIGDIVLIEYEDEKFTTAHATELWIPTKNPGAVPMWSSEVDLATLFENAEGSVSTLGGLSASTRKGMNAATDMAADIKAYVDSIKELEFDLDGDGLPDKEIIKGVGVPGITAVVQSEIKFWAKRKESVPEVYTRLKSYWENLGWTEDRWTPGSVPWSAAYISYVVTRKAPDFPKSAAHRKYADAGFEGRKGGKSWQTFSLLSEVIEVQLGDVVIKPRSGSWGNTHGDVVYKIENGVARLSGGNVSDTAKDVGSLTLGPNNIAGPTSGANIGPYVTIIKKMF